MMLGQQMICIGDILSFCEVTLASIVVAVYFRSASKGNRQVPLHQLFKGAAAMFLA